jgi:glyoxylase-like metal-dependent hydrolase (beta-lactamase superfamily II)
MIERQWVVGPFQCNCRLIACPRTGEAALVDPGDDAERILRGLDGLKTASGAPIRVRYLLHTHGHLDHVGASREVKEALTRQEGAGSAGGARTMPVARIAIHRGDEPLYLNLKKQGALFGIRYDDPLPVDHYLEHEEELRIGDLRLAVMHTPGHSPGSLCLRLHEDSGAQSSETLYTGDTLFQGSVGRTDLWGADGDLMFKNIRERILTLDGDTRVCPGHGPDTRIGIEKKSNPFLI